MKAIVYENYGPPADVLRLQEVDEPVVEDDQVLIKVKAAGVNPYDWHFVRGEPYLMRMMTGFRTPKSPQLGVDFSGEVEAVGARVTEFKPGDAVYGMANGAFAEKVIAKERDIVLKPDNLTYEEAASVPMAGITALQGLRDCGDLQAGQKVLIIGASGGVGSFAVQIAKEIGAHVTGVCSTKNLELVRSLGADEVIDYTKRNFADGDEKYDLIFQLGGIQSPAECRRALTPNGKLMLSSGDSNGRLIGPFDRIIKAKMLAPFVSQTLESLNVVRSKPDLEYLNELFEAGKLTTTVNHTFTLDDVAAAIAQVESGHTRGKVVVVAG